MEKTFEKAYTPKEVRITLNASTGDLRKWCLNLERNGYKFIRNNKNHRVFVENDLVLLRHLQNLVNHQKMQVEDAAMLVVDRLGGSAIEDETGIVPVEKEEKQPEMQRDLLRSNEDKMLVLLEHLKKLDVVNKELLNRLDRQENSNQELIQEVKSLKERFDRMERDRELMESIRESQTKKQQQVLLQIAATQEEKKKGIIAAIKRLFGTE